MLKIKDNVDLKELEKFAKIYNCEFEQEYEFVDKTKGTTQLSEVSIDRKFNNGGHSRQIRFVNKGNNNFYLDYAENKDLLYDLIKADLVEKEEE